MAIRFVEIPDSNCQLTCYFQPLSKQLAFALDGKNFSIAGKFQPLPGERFKLVIETAEFATPDANISYALRIGLLALSVEAAKAFQRNVGHILVTGAQVHPPICEALPSLNTSKAWLTATSLAFDGTEGEWELSAMAPFFDGFNVSAYCDTYFKGTMAALRTLEKAGQWQDLFVLAMCSIDHLAWLSRPMGQSRVTVSDFCKWVHLYLRLSGSGSLEAGEVYNWRCLWVHTYGGQEAVNYPPMALTDNAGTTYIKEKALTTVDVPRFVAAYEKAVWLFAIHCSLDLKLKTLVNERLRSMPRVFKLSTCPAQTLG